MTLPGGGSQDEVVRWLLEMEAKEAIDELRRLSTEAEKTDSVMTSMNAKWGQFGRQTQSVSQDTKKSTDEFKKQENQIQKNTKTADGYNSVLRLIR